MHPEVRGALEQLRVAGFQLATLTNSSAEMSQIQLENADLIDLKDETLSADSVKRLNPAPVPYRMAAERLDVLIREVSIVATHFWDIAGALNVGCASAFVARAGKVLDPAEDNPMSLELSSSKWWPTSLPWMPPLAAGVD